MGVKNITANLLLFICSLGISLLTIEAVLPFLHIQGVERHVFLHRMPVVQYMYGKFHPILGNTLQQNIESAHISYKNYTDYTFRTNQYGFRGGDWDRSKNRKNIVVLGDSFAFGWGVEEQEMFSTLLANRLRKSDPAFQVLNMAQSGYFLDQIVNTFDLYARQFDPVLIIYLYCYNDPYQFPPEVNGRFDIASFRKNISESVWLEEARRNNVNVRRVERFLRGSYVFAFYKNYLAPNFFTEKESPRRAWKERYACTYKDLLPPTPPAGPVTLNTVAQRYIWYCLEQLDKQSGHKPLVLMDTSDKMILHLPDRQKADRWILRDFARQHDNVFFADFESELRRRNDGIPRFLDVDDHWNPEGHRLAAAMLGEILDKKLNL